jgi:peptidylprolyl isomerase
MAEASVQQGDLVDLHYEGRLEDGTVFDSSAGREPLQFTAGSRQLIEGVSQAVLGMSRGEKRTVVVPPEKGYGERNPALQQAVARDQVPGSVNVGDELRATVGDRDIPVWVSALTDGEVVIDANHPLAGKTLVFDLEVVAVHPGGGE